MLLLCSISREGDNKHCFCPSVCPSIHPSVEYIVNNSRTPNFEQRFPVFDATRIPVSRSKSAGPLMLTHIMRRIFQTARPTNFKLGICMEDDNPHQPQAPWPPRSKLKLARSCDQSKLSWPNAVPVSLEAGGGRPCRPNTTATLFVTLITTAGD